jgi:hypothetical protein
VRSKRRDRYSDSTRRAGRLSKQEGPQAAPSLQSLNSTISFNFTASQTSSSHSNTKEKNAQHHSCEHALILRNALQQLEDLEKVAFTTKVCTTTCKTRNIYLLELDIAYLIDVECRDSCESNSHTPALQWFTALATHAILCGQKRRAHSLYWILNFLNSICPDILTCWVLSLTHCAYIMSLLLFETCRFTCQP